MNVTIREGKPQDEQACAEVCYRAFKAIAEQHNFPLDIPVPEVAYGLFSMLFTQPNVYSLVAESEGRIVGSNFLWLDAIAAVGPISVDPEVQNASIGRRLMEGVMARAAQEKSAGVRLVQAGYHNRSLSLYAKLGFNVREPLAVMQGAAINRPMPGFAVRGAAQADLEACASLCRQVHGHERRGELTGAIAGGHASVVERNGRITGYTTGIGFFSHTLGESNDDVKALVAAAKEFSGPGFLVPTRNAELFRWCLEQKLRVVEPMNLMSLGLYNEPAGAFLPSILF